LPYGDSHHLYAVRFSVIVSNPSINFSPKSVIGIATYNARPFGPYDGLAGPIESYTIDDFGYGQKVRFNHGGGGYYYWEYPAQANSQGYNYGYDGWRYSDVKILEIIQQ
jgi:hypothetical protein